MIIHGDCIEKMRELEPSSVDAIVTDPPYGIGFMGKEWDVFEPKNIKDGIKSTDYHGEVKGGLDKRITKKYGSAAMVAGLYDLSRNAEYQEWFTDVAKEMLRVLKPGGFLLAFGGTRTCHRLTCAIEDAGFEIRDMIAWLYGSGFPKSLAIGKAIDKLQGNEREDLGMVDGRSTYDGSNRTPMGKCESEFAKQYGGTRFNATLLNKTKGTSEYEGWGTALKPALEPITVARKPLSEKTVAQNVLKWGTGGINIDGCRVGMAQSDVDMLESKSSKNPTGKKAENVPFIKGIASRPHNQGRFPANLILSYPENEYICKDNLGKEQKDKLYKWLNENT